MLYWSGRAIRAGTCFLQICEWPKEGEEMEKNDEKDMFGFLVGKMMQSKHFDAWLESERKLKEAEAELREAEEELREAEAAEEEARKAAPEANN